MWNGNGPFFLKPEGDERKWKCVVLHGQCWHLYMSRTVSAGCIKIQYNIITLNGLRHLLYFDYLTIDFEKLSGRYIVYKYIYQEAKCN